MIGAHGWTAFAVVRCVAVLSVFATLWPVASWSERAGRPAAVLSPNAVRDGFVATGVTPTLELLRRVDFR